jgi:segregation and condensation protein A
VKRAFGREGNDGAEPDGGQRKPNAVIPHERVGQEQIHDLLFGERLSWQEIIYDLINSEQLDPWDIDLAVLSQRYLDKVRLLEEANFFVSSKVLLAAAILLRLKSELLIERDLPTLDEILYGKKEEKVYAQERITLDEEIPSLVPRTPLPRFKKVTLVELMKALSHAIATETRRIRRVVTLKQHELEAHLPLPKRLFNLQDKIRGVYAKLKTFFSTQDERVAFSQLTSLDRDDRLMTFVSLLHLDNQQKVWLEQDGHFEEIWVLLKEIYEAKNKDVLAKLRAEVAALEEAHEGEVRAEEVSGFSGQIGEVAGS